jgi:hypothetical protein
MRFRSQSPVGRDKKPDYISLRYLSVLLFSAVKKILLISVKKNPDYEPVLASSYPGVKD